MGEKILFNGVFRHLRQLYPNGPFRVLHRESSCISMLVHDLEQYMPSTHGQSEDNTHRQSEVKWLKADLCQGLFLDEVWVYYWANQIQNMLFQDFSQMFYSLPQKLIQHQSKTPGHFTSKLDRQTNGQSNHYTWHTLSAGP